MVCAKISQRRSRVRVEGKGARTTHVRSCAGKKRDERFGFAAGGIDWPRMRRFVSTDGR